MTGSTIFFFNRETDNYEKIKIESYDYTNAMRIIEKIKNLIKKPSISDTNRNKERADTETQLNEYLAEEQKRNKILDKKLCREIQEKNPDEERKSAESRLNEYLAEEQKRKKLLDEKLYQELHGMREKGNNIQVQERDPHRKDPEIKNKNRKIDKTLTAREAQRKPDDVEQKDVQQQILDKQKDDEYNTIIQRVEQSRIEKKGSASSNGSSKPAIDTQFILNEEVSVTNIGPEQLRYTNFPGKIGHTKRKK
jgi:hypothetical protein